MARVIEILKTEEKTAVHRDCGAKIGYYRNEVTSQVIGDYGGGSDTYYFLMCPNCGKKFEVANPS